MYRTKYEYAKPLSHRVAFSMPWEVDEIKIELVDIVRIFIADFEKRAGETPFYIGVNGKMHHHLAKDGFITVDANKDRKFLGMDYRIDPKQRADVLLVGACWQWKRWITWPPDPLEDTDGVKIPDRPIQAKEVPESPMELSPIFKAALMRRSDEIFIYGEQQHGMQPKGLIT